MTSRRGLPWLWRRGQQEEVLRQDAEDRRRAQAARVFIGAPRDPGRRVYAYVKNASDFPVYEAEFWYLSPSGLSDRHDYLGTTLPGEDPFGKQGFGSEEARSKTILTFRDANNVCWIRMPGGVLEEQSAPTARESVLARLRTLPPGTRLRARPVQRGSGGDGGSADGPSGGGGTGDPSGIGGAGTGSGPSDGGNEK